MFWVALADHETSITINFRIFLEESQPVLDHFIFWRFFPFDNAKKSLLFREEGFEGSIGYRHPVFPLGMDDAIKAGKLKPGMLVGSAAFGSGFTWGSAIWRQ